MNQVTKIAASMVLAISCQVSACAKEASSTLDLGADQLRNIISAVSDRWTRIWRDGTAEAYLPLYTYHLRFAYDAGKIASFNENPWGFGFGRGIHDPDGSWRGVYTMAFLDSHAKVEPIAGYGATYAVGTYGRVIASIGYTAFLTAREDSNHYLPLPGVLPLANLTSGRTSLMATFIPGRHNNGNVLFIFGRVELR